MKTIDIQVEGMTCEHCVARVNKSLKELKGIKEVNTVLKENMSHIVAEDDVSIDAVKKSIEEAGYNPGKYEMADKK